MTEQEQAWRKKTRARIWTTIVQARRISLRDLKRRTSYNRGPFDTEKNIEEWYEGLRSLEGHIEFEQGDGKTCRQLWDTESNRLFVVLTPPRKQQEVSALINKVVSGTK